MKLDDTELRSWLAGRAVHSLPYTDGKARLLASPCIVPWRRMKALCIAAVAVCRVYDELCDILARDPSHLGDFFSLTPLESVLWCASGSLWHGIARADIFCTADGSLAVAEVNSDTPSGADEAFLLGEFAQSHYPLFLNPNSHLREAFLSVIDRAYCGLRAHAAVPTVALVYPTDIPEDQGMIMLYQRWLESSGFTAILGSPSNMKVGENGRATLFGREIDILFRHYKTDWWCERSNVWKDARRIPDEMPLLKELENVIGPLSRRDLAVVNPFGAVVTQNKLSLAFFHEKIRLFSANSQEAIRRYIPETRRLVSFGPGVLEREKDNWVLKSDYGCEGAEVIVGHLTNQEAWKHALYLAEPARWIVQRYFHAEEEDRGLIENYGVYLAGGKPAGLYVRLARGVTGTAAVVVPALVRPPLDGAGLTPGVCQTDEMPYEARVRELMQAYTPGERWEPFPMRLLLRSAAEPELIGTFESTESVRAARTAGKALAGLIAHSGEKTRESLLILSDLSGPESVALGAEIAAQADFVLQVENIAHARECVPLRSTLGALAHFAPMVAGSRAGRTHKGKPTAVFVLDRRRLAPEGVGADQFNNRHWAYLPTICALEELAVDTILYIHPDGADTESDDLNEDFVQYTSSGLRLCYASPRSIAGGHGGTLEGLLSATARTPLRRETVFSYMLPPGDECVSYKYNQEMAEP
jgi:glutathionylspermidine synthase